jgi:Dolichyl-phosphate-mannose-protein mannosyltransferase
MVQPASQRPRAVLAERVASVPLARLERLCVLLLMLAALIPRARDVASEFDRGVDGEQGAFFAVAALNYERGDGAGAYPVLNVDRVAQPSERFVYANHPPLVPLLAWNAVRTLGPAGWDTAWQRGEAPRDIELPLRLPFLASHLLALLLLWAVARESYGSSVGLLTLALASASSVGIHFAGLVNYENPGLATALLGVLFGLRWMRSDRKVDLALAGAATALGAAVTFGPLAFLPALWLTAWRRRGLRRAVLYAAVTGACGLVPLVLHHFASRAALAGSLNPIALTVFERAQLLLEPLISGELGFAAWLAIQWEHATVAHGIAIVVATAVALIVRSARSLSPALTTRLSALEFPSRDADDLPLFGILLAGAALIFFAFFRHTSEAQWSFQLWWLPAFSLGGALCLHQLSAPLLRLRAGLSPLALLTLGLALPGLGAQAAWRMRTRGADAPLPMPRDTAAWIASATHSGEFVQHDRALGLNLAVGYYAWRTLLPSPSPEDPSGPRVAAALGLGDRSRYWLGAAANGPLSQIAPTPASLVDREPVRSSAVWRLWRIDPSAAEDI